MYCWLLPRRNLLKRSTNLLQQNSYLQFQPIFVFIRCSLCYMQLTLSRMCFNALILVTENAFVASDLIMLIITDLDSFLRNDTVPSAREFHQELLHRKASLGSSHRSSSTPKDIQKQPSGGSATTTGTTGPAASTFSFSFGVC